MPDNEDNEQNTNDRNDKFFMKFTNFLEEFSWKSVKKYLKKQKKEQDEILKTTSVTKEDKQKEKTKNVKTLLLKGMILGILIIAVVAAIMLADKWNTLKPRPHIESKHILSTRATFGKIGQVDYFMQQNILNDKINTIQKHNQKNFKSLRSTINDQTSLLRETIKSSINQLNIKTDHKINTVKQSLQNNMNKQIALLSQQQQKLNQKIHHMKVTTVFPHLGLKHGHVIFPAFPNSNNNKHKSSLMGSTKRGIKPITIAPKYKIVQVTQTITVQSLKKLPINTLSQLSKKHSFKPFYIDLPIALTRVTLLTGCKAPTLTLGEANPVPVLMSIQGNVYLANNYVTDLRGCFLRGAAYGNINTNRAMIFGTHLSCILVARNGKKYKIEKTFPKGQVWIKGEDGSDGVQGLLVSSDGKILSKAAAMGFMQGFANYFAMQAVPVSPLYNTGALGGTQANTSQIGAKTIGGSFQNGLGTAMNKSFNIIIKQYEKLLNGYYPYIDVKGGRPNLTAFFGGHMRLKVTPFVDPNIQKMEDNNFALGYKTNAKLSTNNKQGI